MGVGSQIGIERSNAHLNGKRLGGCRFGISHMPVLIGVVVGVVLGGYQYPGRVGHGKRIAPDAGSCSAARLGHLIACFAGAHIVPGPVVTWAFFAGCSQGQPVKR